MALSVVANHVAASIESSSWIRRMFETGRKLRADYGADDVFDFSLGNPHLEPPAAVLEAMKQVVADVAPGMHRYMPVSGFEDVRRAVAEWATRWQGMPVPWTNVQMTGGAACGLNVALHTLLDPADGVVVPTPAFSEYPIYIAQAGGVCQWVDTKSDCDLDVDRLAAAIGARTKVVLLNSPNNPTGRVYSAATLECLGAALKARSAALGRPILLVTDDVYRRVVFEGEAAPIFPHYDATIAVGSFSKDLGLAGERIGFLAVHPRFPDREQLLAGLEHSLRTLGFVNANATLQRTIACCLDVPIDLAAYRANRDLMYDGLRRIGYQVDRPSGSLFMFPKSPLADDIAFVGKLAEQKILAVPGIAFGRSGSIRLSFAAPPTAIERSMAGFRAAFEGARS